MLKGVRIVCQDFIKPYAFFQSTEAHDTPLLDIGDCRNREWSSVSQPWSLQHMEMTSSTYKRIFFRFPAPLPQGMLLLDIKQGESTGLFLSSFSLDKWGNTMVNVP